MSEIRIAFQDMGYDEWMAGKVYLRNALGALNTKRDENDYRIKTYLLKPEVPGGQDQDGNGEGLGCGEEVVEYDLPVGWSLSRIANAFARKLFHFDIVMDRELRRQGIDVLFGSVITFKNPRVVKLSFLPDFQHIHFPEFFSDAEIAERNRAFKLSAEYADRIVLLSDSVKKDYEVFTGSRTGKARVLRPFSEVPSHIYHCDPGSMLERYHLPEKFFYLPNQFWKHKNHAAVFQAMKLLKDDGIDINLVCTGSSYDYRWPGYFSDLFRELSESGLYNQVRYLGYVPHDDVLLLTRQCVSMVSPSLFEGWGLTLDEARSVGKRVLISDIPAHREQDPPRASYFDPRDCRELAEKMLEIWEKTGPGPDRELEEKAMEEAGSRILEYRDSFLSIVKEACEERG